VNYRRSRLAAGVRDEVALIVSREVRDPRLGFVTVVRAEMVPDGTLARVFVSPLGDARARADSMKALESSRGYVRRLLSQRMKIRSAPEIQFVEDRGLDATERVSAIFDRLRASESPALASARAPAEEEGAS
jgi:ribosome-binding factor A